jgi:hypothetical protein
LKDDDRCSLLRCIGYLGPASLSKQLSFEKLSDIDPQTFASFISFNFETICIEGTDLYLRELTGGVYFVNHGYSENRGWNTMEYTREVVRIAAGGKQAVRLLPDKGRAAWRRLCMKSPVELSDMYGIMPHADC